MWQSIEINKDLQSEVSFNLFIKYAFQMGNILYNVKDINTESK